MKDDLLESFGCLRKDLKENEELKDVITKVTSDNNSRILIGCGERDCLGGVKGGGGRGAGLGEVTYIEQLQ